MTRVLLYTDQPVLAKGFSAIMSSVAEFDLIGVCYASALLTDTVVSTRPELVLIDLNEDITLEALGELRRRAQALLDLFDIGIEPDTAVERLSVAERQVVEILKALSSGPRVVLFDEPTSSLTQRETQTLFSLIRRLRTEGTAIIYVSHHLPEVLELADRVTVLRDGRRVATLPRTEVTERDLIRLMVGRELSDIYGRPHRPSEKPPKEVLRLRVSGLGRRGVFAEIGFDLRPGEIVGLAGLVGAGRTEVGRALFGLAPATDGEIWLDGRRICPRNAGEAMDAGIAYVTEDRKALGLYLRHSVRDNLAAPWVCRARACRARGFSTAAGFLRDRSSPIHA